MPNIATVLRDEICRLAKREIKSNTFSTKQAVVQYRHVLARLKRDVQAQAKEIAFLKAQERKRLGQPEAHDDKKLEGVRYSARSVRAQRKRLKLSIEAYASLVGVSPLTIHNWESGKGRPKKQRLAALVAIRGIRRREALARLEALTADTKKTSGPRRKPR
ncbi:MAG: helix-turn-helix domain-containing protein [Thermoguttaceae bacterium]